MEIKDGFDYRYGNVDFLSEERREELDRIAINISMDLRQGDFIRTFATAWQLADPFSKRILTAAWLKLIDKLELDGKGLAAIKEEL